MDKTLNKFCKKCRGKCCNLNMMLNEKDFKKLRDKINLKDFKVYETNIYVHWGKCPFLRDNGCSLNERLKPFDCKLFPLTFFYENNKIKIFLNCKCPYAKRVPEKWINKKIKWLKQELKIWKKEQLKSYTSLIKKHSSSKLIFLEEF